MTVCQVVWFNNKMSDKWEIRLHNNATGSTLRSAGYDEEADARRYGNLTWRRLSMRAGGWIELWRGDQLVQRVDVPPMLPEGGPFA